MKYKIKTIDIIGKQWFDKINGNSYFSAQITLNYGMKNEKTFYIPFQYGYGEQYKYTSFNKLIELGYVTAPLNMPVWSYCNDNKIILRYDMKNNCKQTDVKDFGKNNN